MKRVKGWWFGPKDNILGYGDGRKIFVGETHYVEGEIIPCDQGLHLSTRVLDALHYASGPIIYKVEGFGTIVPHGDPVDKYACSHRTYVAGGINVSDEFRRFARMCALDVIHLWDAPDVVKKFLKTGNNEYLAAMRSALREESWANRWDTSRGTWVRLKVRSAAWAASESSSVLAAKGAAKGAARAAAWAAADAAAWAAADAAARAAVWAARKKQNKRLTSMISRRVGRRDRD